MTRILVLVYLASTCFVLSCNIERKIEDEKTYLRWVGDNEYDTRLDDEEFSVCNGDDAVLQYFHLGKGPAYANEKPALLRTFDSKYNPVLNKGQDGYIRIRFIVNCNGEAGRFRILQSDANFKKTEFRKKVVSQLSEITKSIKELVVLYEDNQAVDYYYYLIFKLADGKITEILP